LGAAVRVGQQQPEGHEQDGDLPRLPQAGVDEVLAQEAGDDGGDRADDHAQSQALGLRVGSAAAEHVDAARGHLQQVAAEVGDHADQRAEVKRHVEGLVEGRVLLEVADVGQPRHQDQVPRRRDGQKLGESLHDPQEDGLEPVHGGGGW
jgi:hypothetical protein